MLSGKRVGLHGMSIGRKFELATFLPAEVAEITGVKPTLQRTWRHEGYLAPTKRDAWTRFTLEETAELLVQGQLYQRGIAPRISRIAAQASATQILLWAQQQPHATDDPKGLARGKRWVRRRGRPERFLIQHGIGERDYSFSSDLNAFYVRNSNLNLSAAIVLDLARLGKHLVVSAARALAKVVEVD